MVAGRHNLTRRALLGVGVGACAAAGAAARAVGGSGTDSAPSPFAASPACPEPVEGSNRSPSSSPVQEQGGPSTGSGRTGGGDQAGEAILRRRWTRTLAAYRRAEARVAGFKTEEARLPPERRAFPCDDLEERFGRLDSLAPPPSGDSSPSPPPISSRSR